MKTVRIGNDITIRWTLVFADSGETLAGKELKLYLKHPLITKREVSDYTVEDNVLTWIFRGAEQKKTGVYSLELVCNDGADGMWTIDACDAVELVPCTCKAGGTGGDVELFGKVDTLNGNVIVTAVDKELDSESENPIANKAVAREIEALKENSGSSAFVVETAGNKILGLTNNSTSATILAAIGGDFNVIAQAIREGRQIVFKDTVRGEVVIASLTGYSVNGDTKSITINILHNSYPNSIYNKRITNINGVLKCEICDRYISDGVYIGTKTNIGQNVNIGERVDILGSCTIGKDVFIGSGVHLYGTGILELNYAKIGSGVENSIGTGYIGIYGTSSYEEAICFQYGTTKVFLNNKGMLDKKGNPIIVGTGSSGTGGGNVNIPNISTNVYVVGTYETELGLMCYIDDYGYNRNQIMMEIGTKGSFLGGYANNSLLLHAYGSCPLDDVPSLKGKECIRLGFQDIDLFIGSQQMYLNGNLVGGGGTGSGSDGVIIGFDSDEGHEKHGFVFSTSTMGSDAKSSIGTNAIICSGARIGREAVFGYGGLGITHVDYGIRIFSLSTCILIEDEKGHSVFLT